METERGNRSNERKMFNGGHHANKQIAFFAEQLVQKGPTMKHCATKSNLYINLMTFSCSPFPIPTFCFHPIPIFLEFSFHSMPLVPPQSMIKTLLGILFLRTWKTTSASVLTLSTPIFCPTLFSCLYICICFLCLGKHHCTGSAFWCHPVF